VFKVKIPAEIASGEDFMSITGRCTKKPGTVFGAGYQQCKQ
jgi:hypothetical protein